MIERSMSRGSRLEATRAVFLIRPEMSLRRPRLLIEGIDPPQDAAFTRYSLHFSHSWTRSRGDIISSLLASDDDAAHLRRADCTGSRSMRALTIPIMI